MGSKVHACVHALRSCVPQTNACTEDSSTCTWEWVSSSFHDWARLVCACVSALEGLLWYCIRAYMHTFMHVYIHTSPCLWVWVCVNNFTIDKQHSEHRAWPWVWVSSSPQAFQEHLVCMHQPLPHTCTWLLILEFTPGLGAAASSRAASSWGRQTEGLVDALLVAQPHNTCVVCVCVPACVYVCVYVWMHLYHKRTKYAIPTWAHVCVRVYLCISWLSVYMNAASVCMYAFLQMYVCVYIGEHTYTLYICVCVCRH
jgi:hypothetical protein